MPRLTPSFLHRAYLENPLLPYLLRICRDLPSARNELRWLREHVESSGDPSRLGVRVQRHLKRLCIDRGRGRPLQYILGNQPFGELDIKCRPGVLIPRPETEVYSTHLAETIIKHHAKKTQEESPPLRILDLCTGTGCIALLLHSLLQPNFSNLEILGIDISPKAISLANYNKLSNIAQGLLHARANAQVHFAQADVFSKDAVPDGKWEIVISNPPYISPSGFNRRAYEPKEALVPKSPSIAPDPQNLDATIGDAFYPQLLELAQLVDSQVLIMEVADMEQAQRVACLAIRTNQWTTCEIWRDWPGRYPSKAEVLKLEGGIVEVVGEGDGRAVVLWR